MVLFQRKTIALRGHNIRDLGSTGPTLALLATLREQNLLSAPEHEKYRIGGLMLSYNLERLSLIGRQSGRLALIAMGGLLLSFFLPGILLPGGIISLGMMGYDSLTRIRQAKTFGKKLLENTYGDIVGTLCYFQEIEGELMVNRVLMALEIADGSQGRIVRNLFARAMAKLNDE